MTPPPPHPPAHAAPGVSCVASGVASCVAETRDKPAYGASCVAETRDKPAYRGFRAGATTAAGALP